MTLSVTLAAYFGDWDLVNRCLGSIKDIADEIVIVYGQKSTEKPKTPKKSKIKLVCVPNKYDNFHLMKKRANDLATGDWILQLDADEVVTPSLAREIKKTINSNPVENGFWIPRANYFLGCFLKKGGAYPDYTLRLYRRGLGNLPAKSVHEQAEVKGQTGFLKNDLLHYGNPTFGVYIEKRFQRYTDIMAREIKGGLFRNVFWEPLFNRNQGFLWIYFRHLGFLDGFPGFVWALFSALHFPIAFFKSQEKTYVHRPS